MANELYRAREANTDWRDSGGTLAMTLVSLAAGAGRQGAVLDLGDTTSVSRFYEWRFFCRFDTTPVLDEIVEVWAKFGSDTNHDNDDGTGDIAVSSINKLKNLTYLGGLKVDEAVADVTMSTGGILVLNARQFSPVIWNATQDALSNIAADNGFSIWPIPPQRQ